MCVCLCGWLTCTNNNNTLTNSLERQMKDCVNTRRNDESICYLFIRRSWCVDCVWKIYWRVTKMDYIQRKGLLYDVLPVLFSWPPLLPTHTHTEREREGTACGAMGSLYSLSSQSWRHGCNHFVQFSYSSSTLLLPSVNTLKGCL